MDTKTQNTTQNTLRLGIYFTLGDFGLAESVAVLKGAARGGAALLEVGLPFSDPLLDGPVIQASHNRALQHGALEWADVVAAVQDLKNTNTHLVKGAEQFATVPVQISLMTSAQLLYCEERTHKLPLVDGFLVTDIAHNRASPVPLPSPRVWFLSQDVALHKSFASPPENISMVYLTRVQGITGANQEAADTTAAAIASIQQKTKAPVWLGFGISNSADLIQCHEQGAQGAIVGSAFVKAIELAAQFIPAGAQTESRCKILGAEAEKWVKELLSKAV